jgi:hypothetical protein
MSDAPPYKGPISVEKNQGILDLEDVWRSTLTKNTFESTLDLEDVLYSTLTRDIDYCTSSLCHVKNATILRMQPP